MPTFHDCSNSPKRPRHRGTGGPVENDCVRLIKRDAPLWGWWHVESIQKADVLFTNDVWPDEALESKKPLVKRMDGTFWEKSLQDRNVPYNEAAEQSACVVFPSLFCKVCATNSRWGEIQKPYAWFLAPNAADPLVFHVKDYTRGNAFVAVATDWTRPEKRGESLASVIEALPDSNFVVIGKNFPETKTNNVVRTGYVDHQIMAEIFNQSMAMINLSYRDPSPKVVAQAAACGLHVLYADSGGTREMVLSGEPVHDDDGEHSDDAPPELDLGSVVAKAKGIAQRHGTTFSKRYIRRNATARYSRMIESYASAFEEALSNG